MKRTITALAALLCASSAQAAQTFDMNVNDDCSLTITYTKEAGDTDTLYVYTGEASGGETASVPEGTAI